MAEKSNKYFIDKNFETRLLEVQKFLKSGRLDCLLANDKWAGGMNWLIAHYGNLVPLPATKDKSTMLRENYEDLRDIIGAIMEIKYIVDGYYSDVERILGSMNKESEKFGGDIAYNNTRFAEPYLTEYGPIYDTHDEYMLPFKRKLTLTKSDYSNRVIEKMQRSSLSSYRNFDLGVDSNGKRLECNSLYLAVLHFAGVREKNKKKAPETLSKPTGPKR